MKTPTCPYSCLAKVILCLELVNRVVHKLKTYEKGPFSNCSDLIASHCIGPIYKSELRDSLIRNAQAKHLLMF